MWFTSKKKKLKIELNKAYQKGWSDGACSAHLCALEMMEELAKLINSYETWDTMKLEKINLLSKNIYKCHKRSIEVLMQEPVED